MGEERLTRKVYETKEGGKEKEEGEKNVGEGS